MIIMMMIGFFYVVKMSFLVNSFLGIKVKIE